jgi:hypothetical protein
VHKLLLACKWRKLRIRVWNNRLQEQLALLSTRFVPSVVCSLHVSWGPFYGGSVIADQAIKKIKIFVQIPYDGFLTEDEQNIMKCYRLRRKELPYFILFHEFSHLMDALSHLKCESTKEYRHYLVSRQHMVQAAADYRKLSFEEQADQFAYKCILEHFRNAG